MKLSHLYALTDHNAVLQHAKFSVPARKEGYTVDDNARALVLAAKAARIWPSEQLEGLQRKLVSFLLLMQADDGRFHNLMDFSLRIIDTPSLGDHLGRAIWAAGCVLNSDLPDGLKATARQIFDRALPWAKSGFLRTKANACLGVVERFQAESLDSNLKASVRELAGSLVEAFQKNSSSEWEWFEDILSYENPRLCHALLAAYRALSDSTYLDIATRSLTFLDRVTIVNGCYAPVGNRGWYKKGGERALYDQQPIDAAAMVEAASQAYHSIRTSVFDDSLRRALGWFFGKNLKTVNVYDGSTGAVFDGINDQGLNQNQGSEATVSFLLAAAEFVQCFSEKPTAER